jgi:hypothetical protein
MLDELLRPSRDVEIVVSSDWCFRFRFERAREAIPVESLRIRVAGATYKEMREDPAACAEL